MQKDREYVADEAVIYALQQKEGEAWCSELPDRNSRARLYEAPAESQKALYELEGSANL